MKKKSGCISVSKKFIRENQKNNVKINSKKGGPYSSKEKFMRRHEVFRLHFEGGIPAIKTAEILNVNRNTVNSDISFWYSRLSKEWNRVDPHGWLMKQLNRLETQRARLLDELSKQTVLENKLAIERIIYDIDNRLIHTVLNFVQRVDVMWNHNLRCLNELAEKYDLKERFLGSWEIIKTSTSKYQKIQEILDGPPIKMQIVD